MLCNIVCVRAGGGGGRGEGGSFHLNSSPL